jgi:hypothetical protein
MKNDISMWSLVSIVLLAVGIISNSAGAHELRARVAELEQRQANTERWLGALSLTEQGRTPAERLATAIGHYSRAAQLDPDSADIQAALRGLKRNEVSK